MVSSSSPRGDPDGEHGVPPWFKPEVFDGEEFDPQAYVQDLRRYVPLDTMSAQLSDHLAHLKHELVDVINDNYNDFLSLGGQLSKVEGAVIRIRKPLLDLKEHLAAVSSQVEGSLHSLQSALDHRQQAAVARSKLQLMQDTVHLAAKVEKLLVEVEAVAREDLNTRSALLERVAGEFSRLELNIQQGEGLSCIRAISERMQPVRLKLRQHLNACLQSALEFQNQAAVILLLHAYEVVGDMSGGEQVVRQMFVKPIVSSVTKLQKRGPTAPRLRCITEAFLSSLDEGTGRMLHAAIEPHSGLEGFNFLANSIVAEVHVQVAESMPGAFSSGVPETFLENYGAALEFLQGLEVFCSTPAALERFRKSESVLAFTKRWNLPVYFSLRFQEIAGGLEEVLRSDTICRTDNFEGFFLEVGEVWWSRVCRCVSDGVMVEALADHFLRLILQLVSRLQSWVQEKVQSARVHTVGPTEGEMATAASASAGDFALLIVDLQELAGRVQKDLSVQFLAWAAGWPENVALEVERVFAAAGEQLSSACDDISGWLAEKVASECGAVLQQCVGTAVPMFRSASQPLPKQPSEFIARAVEPFAQLMDDPEAKHLPQQTKRIILSSAADDVFGRYRHLLNELLTFLQKSRSSLKRINKGRAGDTGDSGPGNKGSLTDPELVSMQHFLDVQDFGRSLMKLGVQVGASDVYRKLWATVAPEGNQDVKF